MGRRSGRTVLIVLIALLLVAAAAIVWFWLSTPGRPSVDEGRAVADAFLALLRDGKTDEAWQSTTADFKSYEGKENFRKRAAKSPSLKLPLQFVSTQPVMVGSQSRDEYLYQAKNEQNKMSTVRVLIAQDLGEWKVDRLTVE